MKTGKPIPLFNFFEVVQIVSDQSCHQEIHMMFGVVLGMSYGEECGWGYAVQLFSDASCSDPVDDGWDINEAFLVKTGRTIERDKIYDGTVIRVPSD